MSELRLSISSQDMNSFLNQINNYSKTTIAAVNKEVARATFSIQKNAKQNAPVRKATSKRKGSFALLKGTIDAEIVSGSLSGKVIARAHYAPYREFGTGNLVNIPSGYESYAAQFKGAGIRQVNSKASPFLIPAMENERKRFIANIKVALNKV